MRRVGFRLMRLLDQLLVGAVIVDAWPSLLLSDPDPSLLPNVLSSAQYLAPDRKPILAVRYMVLDSEFERAEHMQAMLDDVVGSKLGGSMLPMDIDVKPFRGVTSVNTTASEPLTPATACQLSPNSAFDSEHALQLEQRYTKTYEAMAMCKYPYQNCPQRDEITRCRVVGCAMAHLSSLMDFINGSASNADYLLNLEDDVVITRELVEQLPSILANLPADWHLLRFNTWNQADDKDRIAPGSPLYLARMPPLGSLDRFQNYMGSSVEVYQRRTAAAALEALIRNGVGDIDFGMARVEPSAEQTFKSYVYWQSPTTLTPPLAFTNEADAKVGSVHFGLRQSTLFERSYRDSLEGSREFAHVSDWAHLHKAQPAPVRLNTFWKRAGNPGPL